MGLVSLVRMINDPWNGKARLVGETMNRWMPFAKRLH